MGQGGWLERVASRVRERSRGQITPPTWELVEHGPLEGLVFYLPGGPAAPWAYAIRAGEYEIAAMEALAGLARRGGVMYDIGAHVGVFSCAWLRLGGNRVESFEPLPSTAAVLQSTVNRNKISAYIKVHNVALADQNGRATMTADDSDLGAASAAFVSEIGPADVLYGLSHDSAAKIPVTVRRLDDYFAELELPPPVALKIDVEGAEAAVVEGALELIKAHRPAILCEVHTIEAGLLLAERLKGFGYEMQIIGKNGIQPSCLWTLPDAVKTG